jgi:DNA-binding NarL/FixJ family response regulator
MLKLIIINKSIEQAEDLKITLGNYYFIQGYYITFEKLAESQDIKLKNTQTNIIIYCNKDVNELTKIKKEFKSAEIIIYNDLENDKLLFNAIQMGVKNFVHYSQKKNELLDIIEIVGLGGCYISNSITYKLYSFIQKIGELMLGKTIGQYHTLSKREITVYELLLSGISYKDIAKKLSISIDTIRKHISRIYKKLKINSKGELYNLHYNVLANSKYYQQLSYQN